MPFPLLFVVSVDVVTLLIVFEATTSSSLKSCSKCTLYVLFSSDGPKDARILS
ncbi:hypothetical protein M758_4G113900 [Ceratodon purpureus]|nr:hypothetical protein M758_4G113900 [Ceratodon purpureus]